MKFRSIRMKNFMRYKGENHIAFSCDPKKNVTVVLGDNTVGKTTIAQAFRFGLYGAIQADRRRRGEDYVLLNNDVLALMDADGRAEVAVEILAEDADREYRIYRSVGYTRAYPKMIAQEYRKTFSLHIAEKGHADAEVEIKEEKAEEVIGELFPRDLSHYFLFDGERWNDVSVGGVRENIKDSVHILTGLSAYQRALWHLKDMGSASVIRKYKSRITGSGALYENLEKERRRMERDIEECERQAGIIEINLRNYEGKIRDVERELEENKNTELLQAKRKTLQVLGKSQAERCIADYKLLVTEYSDKAYMLFARPMVKAALAMVKAVAGERRDIPHMRQASIDYILRTGVCICGTPIREGSGELECLLEQRSYLPPADIGSLLGEFERTARRWKSRSADTGTELVQAAKRVDAAVREYEETGSELAALEGKLEEEIDFAAIKGRLRDYRAEMQKLSNQKGVLQGRAENGRRRIERIESEMKSLEAQSAENQKWRERVAVAETVYARMSKDFADKEKKTFLELNERIGQNFSRMFHAQDKKILLDSQYNIRMEYRTELGYREEKNLSEGEKIARNFAFIVTIMEYSRKKKQQKEGRDAALGDTLPIVLDGPFSKLGDENIRLIAKVLPEVSEQVIIFMLEKDWKYTGLDAYVGARYSIEMEADKAYASVRRTDGIPECAAAKPRQ